MCGDYLTGTLLLVENTPSVSADGQMSHLPIAVTRHLPRSDLGGEIFVCAHSVQPTLLEKAGWWVQLAAGQWDPPTHIGTHQEAEQWEC